MNGNRDLTDKELVDQQFERKLAWGYGSAVPDDTKAAWGARLILTADAGGDLLYDRQGGFGNMEDTARLRDHLNKVRPWRDQLARLVREGTVRSDEPNEVVVHDDDVIRVVGNSNGSYGYFYIAAWLK